MRGSLTIPSKNSFKNDESEETRAADMSDVVRHATKLIVAKLQRKQRSKNELKRKKYRDLNEKQFKANSEFFPYPEVRLNSRAAYTSNLIDMSRWDRPVEWFNTAAEQVGKFCPRLRLLFTKFGEEVNREIRSVYAQVCSAVLRAPNGIKLALFWDILRANRIAVDPDKPKVWALNQEDYDRHCRMSRAYKKMCSIRAQALEFHSRFKPRPGQIETAKPKRILNVYGFDGVVVGELTLKGRINYYAAIESVLNELSKDIPFNFVSNTGLSDFSISVRGVKTWTAPEDTDVSRPSRQPRQKTPGQPVRILQFLPFGAVDEVFNDFGRFTRTYDEDDNQVLNYQIAPEDKVVYPPSLGWQRQEERLSKAAFFNLLKEKKSHKSILLSGDVEQNPGPKNRRNKNKEAKNAPPTAQAIAKRAEEAHNAVEVKEAPREPTPEEKAEKEKLARFKHVYQPAHLHQTAITGNVYRFVTDAACNKIIDVPFVGTLADGLLLKPGNAQQRAQMAKRCETILGQPTRANKKLMWCLALSILTYLIEVNVYVVLCQLLTGLYLLVNLAWSQSDHSSRDYDEVMVKMTYCMASKMWAQLSEDAPINDRRCELTYDNCVYHEIIVSDNLGTQDDDYRAPQFGGVSITSRPDYRDVQYTKQVNRAGMTFLESHDFPLVDWAIASKHVVQARDNIQETLRSAAGRMLGDAAHAWTMADRMRFQANAILSFAQIGSDLYEARSFQLPLSN